MVVGVLKNIRMLSKFMQKNELDNITGLLDFYEEHNNYYALFCFKKNNVLLYCPKKDMAKERLGNYILKNYPNLFLVDEQVSTKILLTNDDEIYLLLQPLLVHNKRIGELMILSKNNFAIKDMILAEYVGLAICKNLEAREYDQGDNEAIDRALKVFSYSELLILQKIILEIPEDKGIIVISSIADKHGLSRSIGVNALRKLEGTGLISTRSLGSKGTFVEIRSNNLKKYINDNCEHLG